MQLAKPTKYILRMSFVGSLSKTMLLDTLLTRFMILILKSKSRAVRVR